MASWKPTAGTSVRLTQRLPIEMLVPLAGKLPAGMHGHLLDGEYPCVSCASLAAAC